ncbi:hypothetical protein HMPREF9120_02273 [Neisseria sp. oral taxon 020 str. F0370]|nr:hypothetical protein HMPREF9120_02273 [Neisseria sp. oral taxon 020 str. F0370]
MRTTADCIGAAACRQRGRLKTQSGAAKCRCGRPPRLSDGLSWLCRTRRYNRPPV